MDINTQGSENLNTDCYSTLNKQYVTNNNNLKTLLSKIQNYKLIYLKTDCINNLNKNKTYGHIVTKLNAITELVLSSKDSDDLKFYQLTEQIATLYFKLKRNHNFHLSKNILQDLLDYFKPEITNSDHYLFQVSQNMV